MWEQEEMLVPEMISTHSKNNFLFLSYTYIVICKCFQFGPVLKFGVWYRVKSFLSG